MREKTRDPVIKPLPVPIKSLEAVKRALPLGVLVSLPPLPPTPKLLTVKLAENSPEPVEGTEEIVNLPLRLSLPSKGVDEGDSVKVGVGRKEGDTKAVTETEKEEALLGEAVPSESIDAMVSVAALEISDVGVSVGMGGVEIEPRGLLEEEREGLDEAEWEGLVEIDREAFADLETMEEGEEVRVVRGERDIEGLPLPHLEPRGDLEGEDCREREGEKEGEGTTLLDTLTLLLGSLGVKVPPPPPPA